MNKKYNNTKIKKLINTKWFDEFDKEQKNKSEKV